MKLEQLSFTTKNGKTVVFRSATAENAQKEIDYLKQLCSESRFLLSEPEDVTYTESGEEEYIKIKENSSNALIIEAFVDGALIGNGSFEPVSDAKRLSHRATFGIGILKKYCSLGIGTKLMEILIEKAKECSYEIIELGVFSKNTVAINLYKKMGFEKCGVIKNAVKYEDSSYDDEVLMQRFL